MVEMRSGAEPEITGVLELAPDEIGDWESGYQTGRNVRDTHPEEARLVFLRFQGK